MKNSQIKANQWKYEPPQINGKEKIDDMSLVVGMYENYIVTKTGYLVGIVESTGVNIDLLSEYEQEDVFSSYNSFLMAMIGDQTNELHQYIEITIPVNMTEYIISLKKKYLQAKRASNPNLFVIRLIASYIDYYSNLQAQKTMTTKRHLIVIRTKIKNKSIDELEMAQLILTDKLEGIKRNLENVFKDVDIQANILTGREVTGILKTLINSKC